MSYKKIGRRLLLAGVIILLVSIFLLCNTNSLWTFITLGLSVLINTAGVFLLTLK